MILSSSDIYTAVVHCYDDGKCFHGFTPTNRLLFMGVPDYDLRAIFFRSAWETHPEHSKLDLTDFDGMNTSCDDYDVKTIYETGIRKAVISAYPDIFDSLESIQFITTENGLMVKSYKMDSLEQLKYLIKHYNLGQYTAWDFTSLFTDIFYVNHDETLTEEYRQYFLPLAECCERFSPYSEDINLPDSPFKSKEDVDMVVDKYVKGV